MKISAIIFDMDGLMLDTETIAYQAWKQAASELGYMFEEDDYYALVGKSIPIIEQGILDALGKGFNLDKAVKLKASYFEDSISKSGIPIKSGLLELLEVIDQLDLKKAVASSSHKQAILKRLTITNLIDRFQIIVGGDEIQNGKPAPDIFLEAAKQLDVPPKECIVLEDSSAGIQAAHSAGMVPIMIPDKNQPDPATQEWASHILHSLHEVIPLLLTSASQSTLQ